MTRFRMNVLWVEITNDLRVLYLKKPMFAPFIFIFYFDEVQQGIGHCLQRAVPHASQYRLSLISLDSEISAQLDSREG